jgi:NDP-hexose 3,5-(Or5-) epimerase
MEIVELAVPDSYLVTPKKLEDVRGCFYEAFKVEELARVTGHHMEVVQVNHSVSRRGTLRGIHGTRVPPGQAKYVSCAQGEVLDITVDLRIGSPTFGQCAATHLRAGTGMGVYMAEGLGHGFYALTDDVLMTYLCSTPYIPEIVVEVNALDPDLALPWGITSEPLMSEKDRNTPSLADAIAGGNLPLYEDCLATYEKQRTAGA